MDEQRKAWRYLHQQRINRISSLEFYGNQYKQYLLGQCSKSHVLSVLENGLGIYPSELIQWVELFAEIDTFYELKSRQIPLKGQHLFMDRHKYLFRESYKSVSLFNREEHYLQSFCEHFFRYCESLLYNNHRKGYIASDLLTVKTAKAMAEQCYQQELIILSNVCAKDSFHDRLKQIIWIIANMIMLASQEGMLALLLSGQTACEIMKDNTHDKMTPFLKYALELKVNGYQDSSIATRLELKYLEIVKDSSSSVDDLKLAYFIKEAQQGFTYGNGNVFFDLCCDIGALSKNELKQVHSFLVAAGILIEEECSADANNLMI
jgi:hypothetical protein